MIHTGEVVLVTGAAGFIGSYIAGHLNRLGYNKLVLVDDFTVERKAANYKDKAYTELVQRTVLHDWLLAYGNKVSFVIHLGARTDTTEMDYEVHRLLNLEYSKMVWEHCVALRIPLIYASSAATYGNGELGYKDAHELVGKLQPLNPYGVSKNEFDLWALAQPQTPPFWAGLKFFNVFGPNEYHKGRMASVIFHAYNSINTTGSVRLFKSHRPDYKDGEQIRDFIYVADIAAIILWLMEHQPESGLYNAGTGKARTFNDLVLAIYAALDKQPNINYIDTPIDIRDKYQYYTEADMSKLKAAGFDHEFQPLEASVADYVQGYLRSGSYY